MNPSATTSDAEALLDEIARAVRLKEGPAGVRAVLRAVYQHEPIALASLTRAVGIPLPVLAAMRRELERRGYLERRGGIAFTTKGRQIAAALRFSAHAEFACPECAGTTIDIPDALAPVLEALERHSPQRPSVDTSLDQTSATPTTALRRALFMYRSGALDGMRVLLLGDDDSVSLAIALLDKHLHPQSALTERLTVLEYDERWVEHLRNVAREATVAIEFVQHDLRQPLPDALRSAFDTVETDPSYTLEGLRLFLSRGVQALRPGAGHQIFLSFGAKPPDEMLAVQRWLTESGLSIQQVVPRFNEYAGASLLGGRSHLFHLVTTGSTTTADADASYSGPLYTGEVRPMLRLYACIACSRKYRVGASEPFASIEALKATGCSDCGGARFRLVRRERQAP